MLATPIGRLRASGLAEGVSLLVLFGIAMPLKYAAHLPQAVKIVGWIHGVLFILYAISLLKAYARTEWPLKRAAVLFFAAFVPFGTILTDRRLRLEEAAQ